MNFQQKLFEVKLLLHSIKEDKKRAEKLGLDTSQFHGIEGEAFACYIIWVILNDKTYIPDAFHNISKKQYRGYIVLLRYHLEEKNIDKPVCLRVRIGQI